MFIIINSLKWWFCDHTLTQERIGTFFSCVQPSVLLLKCKYCIVFHYWLRKMEKPYHAEPSSLWHLAIVLFWLQVERFCNFISVSKLLLYLFDDGFSICCWPSVKHSLATSLGSQIVDFSRISNVSISFDVLSSTVNLKNPFHAFKLKWIAIILFISIFGRVVIFAPLTL